MIGANVVATLVTSAVGLLIAAVTLPVAGGGLACRLLVDHSLRSHLVVGVHPGLVPRVINRILVRMGRPPVDYPARVRAFVRPAAWSCLVWIAMGGHLRSLVMPRPMVVHV